MSESLLLDKIELTRKEMVTLSNIYGLTSKATIQASQKLDDLLNLFYSYQNNPHAPTRKSS